MQLFSRRLVGTVLGCLTLLSACGGGAPDTAPTEGPASAAPDAGATEYSPVDAVPDVIPDVVPEVVRDSVALAAAAVAPATGASFVVVQRPGGANLYVAPNGRNDNDGSRQRPSATLARAAQSASAGTTIWIVGGRYRWPEGTWLPIDGNADNWVVIRPVETVAGKPDSVVIVGDGVFDAEGPACLFTPGSYLDIRNITCESFGNAGFLLLGVHHVRVFGSTVRNVGGTGIAIYTGYYPPQTTVTPAYQVVIEANNIINTNLRWKKADFRSPNRLPPWGQGVSVFADQVTVRNNRIDATIGEGLGVIGVGIWAVNNRITNSCSPGLYLDTTSGSLLERNLVANSNPAFFANCPITDWSNGQPMTGSGIQVAAETDSYTGRPQPHLRDNVIRNNIIINTRQAFFYGSYAYDNQGGDGMKGMRIVNNTFVGSAESLLFLGDRCVDAANPLACRADPRTVHQDTVFANNIFYWTGPTAGKRVSAVDNAVGLRFSNNLWFGASAAGAAGSGDVAGNPLFSVGSGFSAANYRIKPGSAAIGKANGAYVPPVDFFGYWRTSPHHLDIGALRGP